MEAADRAAAGGRRRARSARPERAPFDVVLTDLKLPDGSGPRRRAVGAPTRSRAPAVVVMTGYGTVAAAVEAMKLGAADFLEKPVELEQLFAAGRRAHRRARDEPPLFEVAGRAADRRRASAPPGRAAAPRARRADREHGAPDRRERHRQGALRARPPRALAAARRAVRGGQLRGDPGDAASRSELFGHEKGAFTGADRRRPGRFEQAQGGTLFLDEIGELPLAVQAKVLRVLEERRFERVGGARRSRADVRLVAATNRDLEAMVAPGEFRSDLFYRLEVFPIELPAAARARERRAAPRAPPARDARRGRQRREPPELAAEAPNAGSPRSPGRATCASSRTCSSAR